MIIFVDEERKPIKLVHTRSRENSQPALTPPRDVDTAIINFGGGDRQEQNPLRALSHNMDGSSSSSRKSAERQTPGNGPSEAKGILDRLRKQGNSSSNVGPDNHSTML